MLILSIVKFKTFITKEFAIINKVATIELVSYIRIFIPDFYISSIGLKLIFLVTIIYFLKNAISFR